MGYAGLKKWGDGDDAAGLVYEYVESIVKILNRGLKEKGNCCNPSGAVNVALFNESFILPIAKELAMAENYESPLLHLLQSVHDKLATEAIEGKGLSADEWGGSSNKRMHINAYNRMLNHLDITIRILSTYPEQRAVSMYRRLAAKRKKS